MGLMVQQKLLEPLSEADHAKVLERCAIKAVDTGAVIVHHQEQSREVFLVLEGEVSVKLFSLNGREVSYRSLYAGEYFGEMAAIDGQPRSATIIAMRPSRIAVMRPEEFRRLLSDHPPVALRVLEDMSARIRSLTERVLELTTLTVRGRLIIEILRIAHEAGTWSGPARIASVPTHAELASRISTHREAVTRELRQLVQDGVIRREGRALIVPDVGTLEDYAAAFRDRGPA